jgi:hypothetical protein
LPVQRQLVPATTFLESLATPSAENFSDLSLVKLKKKEFLDTFQAL